MLKGLGFSGTITGLGFGAGVLACLLKKLFTGAYFFFLYLAPQLAGAILTIVLTTFLGAAKVADINGILFSLGFAL